MRFSSTTLITEVTSITSNLDGDEKLLTLNPELAEKEKRGEAIVGCWAPMELLQDHKAEFSELLAEMIEDIAMERAIDEGKTTELVSRDTIFQLLEPVHTFSNIL